MKTTMLKTVLTIFATTFIISCSNSGGKDVTKDPKYADAYHHFLVPTQTL